MDGKVRVVPKNRSSSSAKTTPLPPPLLARQEQALIEAYEAEGWRGAAREKVRPVQEILRAKAQVRSSVAILRDCLRVCDEAEGDRAIPAELFDADGELDQRHIFCAKCGRNDATDDNDIVLCDGPCNRAYHCTCLVPPLDINLLNEDEGWLCPACDHKVRGFLGCGVALGRTL